METWYTEKNKLLDKFSDAVKQKKYKKVDYPLWRTLTNINENVCCVVKDTGTISGTNRYDIISILKDAEFGTFWADDNSLGSFIDQNFGLSWVASPSNLNKGDVPDMTQETISNAYATGGYTTAGTIINSHDYVTDHTITTGDPGYRTNTVTIPSYSYIYNGGLSSQDEVKKIINDILNEKEKEKEKMDTSKMFKFDFGPVSGSQFRMSPYGLAVRTAANGWVAFNTKTSELVDVEVLNFDVSKMIYKMPVAMGAIAVGDILIHGGKPVFVRSIGDGVVNVIDYSTASVMNILPVKSPFGFNFFTKVMCLVDMSGMSAASPENPFGNMLPYLLLSEGKDFDPLMLMLMGGGTASISSNPMMMYFLLNDSGDNKSLLPLIMMMNGGGMPSGNAGPATI